MKTYVAGIIALVALGVSYSVQAAADSGDLTLERIITKDEFRTEHFGPIRWLDDGTGYTTVERAGDGKGSEIVRHDPETGKRDVLVTAAQLTPKGSKSALGIDDYVWSKDGKQLLVFTNTRRVWRQNTRGDYWVLNRDGNALKKLGGDGPEASLMFGKFDSQGKRFAYVRNSDIYVENLADGKTIRLTRDGSPTHINGTFDWVYEEELSLRDGFRWSPDGESIAFWQLDTEGMKDYVLVNTTDALYPKLTTIRYPKVGEQNPSCRVGVIDVRADAKPRWMNVPGDPREHYIARMEWAGNSDELVLQQLNRLQNTDKIMLANAQTGAVKTILTEQDAAWIDVVDELHWVNDGKQFVWPSERDGWRHLYLASRDGSKCEQITSGAFDVIDNLRVDSKAGVIDFTASPQNATQAYLFRTSIDGKTPPRRLSPREQPGTHSYQIAPSGKWAIHTYSTMNDPPVIELVSLPDHKVARTLVSNNALREKLKSVRKRNAEFFRVNIDGGVDLDGWIIKPPDFREDRRYPVIVHVYGEPAGQTVVDHWGGQRYLWHQLLAQHGYIVLSVDNRGTPAPKGRAWRKCIYRQIGILASKDQADALRTLEKQWPFLDAKRVGVWGWSGGGSMTLNAMFRYPDLYQTGIAIAFISDQRLYDTIYQERYMGLPKDNPEGFRDGSPITFAGGLMGNLLLIHGTGDDNCHYQSCERLVDRLIALNKSFEMMAYPNRTHAIREGENTSRHLYETMLRYFERNLPAGPQE